MSETPFDQPEADQDPAEKFLDIVRDAYIADGDLTPFEAIGVLACLSHEILNTWHLVSPDEEDEGDLDG